MAKTKRRKKGGALFYLIVIILIGIMGYSGYQLYTIYQKYHVGNVKYQEIQEEAGAAEGGPLDLNWKKLQKKYPAIRGWLYLEDTVINYPIAQGEDNDFYLHHLINGDYEWKGCLFLDFRNDGKFRDHLTVIYGHRMKDGSMFKPLVQYREESFYKKHPVLLLSTPERDYDILVFAACTIPADSERYQMEWSEESNEDKQEYLDWIYSCTELATDVKVSPKDRIVMMSTCTYEFDEARLVVFGKLVPKD